MINTCGNKTTHWLILGWLFINLLTSCQTNDNNNLTIATAASTQFAIEKIVSAFTENTGIEAEIILGSSGKHTAQIEAGAPYDIFISADLKYPARLYKLGLTVAEPTIFAYGKLVLWSLNDSIDLDINNLPSANVTHIAMPNPKTAPYGLAAKEALLFHNIYHSIDSKLVFGESVAQTNQFILSRSAGVGFSAASITMAPEMKSKGLWQEVASISYSPIAQTVVVISQSGQLLNAEKFYLFLFSNEAQDILRGHGYKILQTE